MLSSMCAMIVFFPENKTRRSSDWDERRARGSTQVQHLPT
jgi:hypothetical protein